MRTPFFFFFFTVSLIKAQETVYLPFNGNATDFSINKNHGRIYGPVKTGPDRFGNPCGALYFDGMSNYIEIPTISRYRKIRTAFTLTAWIKLPRNSTGPLTWLTLLCKGDEAVESEFNPAFRVQLMQAQHQSTVSISTDFTEPDVDFNLHRFPVGRWFFFALIYDGTMVSYYIDQKCVFKFPYRRLLATNSAPITIGLDIPGASEWFHGFLDDYRLFDYALTEKEIGSIRLEQSNTTSILDLTHNKCQPDTTLFVDLNCHAVLNYSLPTFQYDCQDGVAIKSSGPDSGAVLKPGSYSLKFEAASSVGASTPYMCESQIWVRDTLSPLFPVQNDSTILLPLGDTSMPVFYSLPNVSDNCGVVNTFHVLGPKSGDTFVEGKNTVVFKATDVAGNEQIWQRSFYLVTTTAPDSIVIADSLAVNFNRSYTLVFFDDGKEDNDTVSVFWNGMERLNKIGLRNKKKGVHLLVITPQLGYPNMLVSKAWNLGGVPPNTMKLLVFEGSHSDISSLNKIKPLFQRSVRSEPGISGAIKFIPI